MFIQVIQGKTSDADGLSRQFDRWREELQPGATGYLGATGGVADDGTVVMMARFESEDAARANSDRPEQGEWWAETSKYLEGDVSFRDSTDVDLMMGGGRDDAGFVQIMQGRVTDRARLKELEDQFMPQLREMRPDVLGSIRAWDGDHFTAAIYFASEEAAREGEARTASEGDGPPEFVQLVQDLSFVDLKDPWLYSA